MWNRTFLFIDIFTIIYYNDYKTTGKDGWTPSALGFILNEK